MQELAEKHGEILFCKVDVDECAVRIVLMPSVLCLATAANICNACRRWQDVATSEKVTAMPTFFFYKNGHKVAEVIGADIHQVIANIERLM